jgi:putative Mn2+ efflux pump MntP
MTARSGAKKSFDGGLVVDKASLFIDVKHPLHISLWESFAKWRAPSPRGGRRNVGWTDSFVVVYFTGIGPTMDIATIILIAFGLSMDAFAVSITSGVAMKEPSVKYALRTAAFFGAFQAIMPVIGWLCGVGLKGFLSGIDHWIAFALLGFVGTKMIYESRRLEPSEASSVHMGLSVLLMLSVATSIDALAVGFGFAFLGVALITPVLVIGLVTFCLSFLGVLTGNRVGHLLGNRAKVAGGLVLIAIGLKILIEHLMGKA